MTKDSAGARSTHLPDIMGSEVNKCSVTDSRFCWSTMLIVNLVSCLLLAVVSSITGAQEVDDHQSETPPYIQSGLVKLLIEGYTEDTLRELATNSNIKLSTEQLAFLRQRLKQIYQYIIKHPSLKEKRLWVGDDKPIFPPSSYQNDYLEQVNNFKSHNRRYHGVKRSGVRLTRRSMLSRQYVFSEEVCTTELGWERVNTSYDVNEKEVQVAQDIISQYVFAYRCSRPSQQCKGISNLYQSECTERHGWVYLYHRKLEFPDREPEWGYVRVPHHCACKITRRVSVRR